MARYAESVEVTVGTTNTHATVELKLIVDLENITRPVHEALAYLPEAEGFHFPVHIDADTVVRIKQMYEDYMESIMNCPECYGRVQSRPCPTCRGVGQLTADGNPIGNRHAKRQKGSHNPGRASAVPRRNGRHNDPKHRNGLN